MTPAERRARDVIGFAKTMESVKKSAGRAAILDGSRVAAEIKREVAADVAVLARDHGIVPCLSVVRVGNDPASEVYVRNKVKTSHELGLRSEHLALSADITSQELLETVATLNARDDVDGILVQLPLPKGNDERLIIESVEPNKDVDGFHPLNIGRMITGAPAFVPCTPAGIYEMLQRENIQMRGAHAVVIGRSHIVGRPMAQLLLRADATVTICHSRTPDLAEHTRRADILICAVGVPAATTDLSGFGAYVQRHVPDHNNRGILVLDRRAQRGAAGAEPVDAKARRQRRSTRSTPISARDFFGAHADERIETIRKRGYTLIGDVHPAEVERVASRLTPVPGGVPRSPARHSCRTPPAAGRTRGPRRCGRGRPAPGYRAD